MKKLSVFLIVLVLCFMWLVPSASAQDDFAWPIAGEVILGFAQDDHRGIDISAGAGDLIVAAQDGVICWIGKTPRGEPYISIEHPSGLSSTYLPVIASVSKGQTVSAGGTIGALSSEIDESSQVEHLHFGLYETATRDNKKYLDPIAYLPPLSMQKQEGDESAITDGTTTEVDDAQSPQASESQILNVQNPAEEVPTQPQDLQEPVEVPVPKIQGSYLLEQKSPAAQPVVKSVTSTRATLVGNKSTGVQGSDLANIGSINAAPKVSSKESVATNTESTASNAAQVAPQIVSLKQGAMVQSAPARASARHSLALQQNPFSSPAGRRSVKSIEKQSSQPGPKWANQVINWQALPEVIAALAVAIIFGLSFAQVASSAKRIGQNPPVALDATCC